MKDDRCREVLKKICADAGKRETSPFCKEVAKHLASCADCRDQALSLRGTLELYWCLEREEVPAEVSARLRAALGLTDPQDPPISS
jgi:hypothetical protein